MKLVFIENNRPVTDSLTVAETFGKRHADVMRDIRNLDCSEEFNQRNFAQIDYTDANGRTYPKYIITQDGFTFLVMGYTGKEAARFKEMYIDEFNRMRDELQHQLTRPALPQTYLEALEALVTSEKEKILLHEANESHKQTIRELEPKAAMYNMVVAAENTQPVGTVARTVGMGRNNLFKFLREKKILMPGSTLPYQRYIDAGYFMVKEVPTKRGDKIVNEATTRVTAKGIDYIAKLVRGA